MIIPQHPFSVKVNQIHQTPHALRKQLFLSIVCYRIYANLSTQKWYNVWSLTEKKPYNSFCAFYALRYQSTMRKSLEEDEK